VAGTGVGPQFEFLLALDVEVGEIVSMGAGPLGERRWVSILGGRFEGPALRGRVLAGGADWQIVRRDGVIDVDARYAIEAHDGSRIQVISQGYRHGPPDVLAALGRGETVAAERYFFRTVMRFDTGARELDWLNGTIAVATAERMAHLVKLRAWRLL
jgi:hypothetical protein